MLLVEIASSTHHSLFKLAAKIDELSTQSGLLLLGLVQASCRLSVLLQGLRLEIVLAVA
jgi:hypothetical protein